MAHPSLCKCSVCTVAVFQATPACSRAGGCIIDWVGELKGSQCAKDTMALYCKCMRWDLRVRRHEEEASDASLTLQVRGWGGFCVVWVDPGEEDEPIMEVSTHELLSALLLVPEGEWLTASQCLLVLWLTEGNMSILRLKTVVPLTTLPPK